MSIKSEVANVKENLIKSRKAILARGGEIATDAGFKDLPSAILNIPPDFALSFIEDDGVAYQKTAPENSLPYAQIKKIGGMTYKSKNLIPFPYADTSKTENGITWTVNADGSVTANGTATGNSYFTFVRSSTLLTIPYDMTISGCPSGGDSLKFEIHVWKGGFTISDIGSSNKVPAGTTYEEIYAVVRAGYTANNLTFKPMLNAGNTALPYEPFFKGLRHTKVTEIKSEGANLIPYPYQNTTKSESGITFTDNGDGSISVRGTATANAVFYLYDNRKECPFVKQGEYYSRNMTSVDYGVYFIVNYYPKGSADDSSYSEWIVGATAQTPTDFEGCIMYLVVLSGTTIDTTVTPMLNHGSVSLPYKPYVGTLDTFAIPQAVQELDGYGQGNPENPLEYNYIDFISKEFISYGYVSDGVWVAYTEIKRTDISSLLAENNFIKVEGGGALTFENEYKYAVPSTVKYVLGVG